MDARDVAKLDYLEGRGRCVTLADVYEGNTDGRTIGLRHDCDDRGLDSMVAIAQWEAGRSRSSTFYVLHTAPWFGSKECIDAVKRVANLGHEVGLHHNALAEWWRTRRDPFLIFEEALRKLESWVGPTRSIAGHGDEACYEGRFINYTMFGKRAGNEWRDFYELTGMMPRPAEEFGIEFHGDHLPRSCYISDSGGEWTHDLTDVLRDFPFETNTIILQHPDWYTPELFA